MATVHDRDGKLVAYGLSASAYIVTSRPRNTNPLQASAHSRTKQRRANLALDNASPIPVTRNRALLSRFSAVDSLGQQQFGESASTGRLPVVELAVDLSGGAPVPIVDPRSQYLPQELHDFLSLNPTDGYQPIPTLLAALPPSCTWRGGIVTSLLVSGLPPDGPIYARFGDNVVETVRIRYHS